MKYSWKASSKSAVVYLTPRRGDFRVLSGSIMAGDNADRLVEHMRRVGIEAGLFESLPGGRWRLTEDVIMNSPLEAVRVFLGAAEAQKADWRDRNDQPVILDDLPQSRRRA